MANEQSFTNPDPISNSVAWWVLDGLQTGRAHALGGQTATGRSSAGRRWSVIITEFEKLEALVRYYDVCGLEAVAVEVDD